MPKPTKRGWWRLWVPALRRWECVYVTPNRGGLEFEGLGAWIQVVSDLPDWMWGKEIEMPPAPPESTNA